MSVKSACVFLLCFALFALSVCSRQNIDANATVSNSGKTEAIAEAEKGSIANTVNEIPKSMLRPEREGMETAAQALLYSAFVYDAKKMTPVITEGNGVISFRYLKNEDDPSDFFVIDFHDEYDYPMTLYHFCHSNEKEQVYIENDATFLFNDEMVTEAQNFVELIYGIDCSDATVTAYGYANKVSVQLEVEENKIFHVRFYYQDLKPVGILYFPSADYAKEAMEINNAVLLYAHSVEN